ncbi:tetratricopeptide repeat protein [Algoriphagus halophytocola]|uniref:Tetratricopeptide repeat protein n=1 Tax=Algoriphagus halophytocola TaxID=2991499 RepID=A0ABY6MGJ8_9BACT|nr:MULTISPECIES: tetratricopeptide repeat protein [unclassified Algoriphagus]UZD21446.1 tetratricopeptide repeat protein [Algoriphagus sp. TR-M5]WBL42658.1 tetratricopeptide repeat protein [Algoriphagus sp. TR-M9]
MKKTQLILIVVGVLAIAGLYALPSVVVDNEGQADGVSQDNAAASSESTEAIAMHEPELTPDQQLQLNTLKLQVKEDSSSEDIVSSSEELAGIYQEIGKYDSAGYYLGLAYENRPETELAEKAGNAYYEAFSFALDQEKVNYTAEQTRKYLNLVLDNDPTRLDLKTKIAMTYVSSSNPMQGITMLREILEEDPQNEDGLFNMGILSMQSGQYKRATERFEELVKYHPDNLQGQFYLGVSYFESDQKNKAKAQFEKVKELTDDPTIIGTVDTYLDQL